MITTHRSMSTTSSERTVATRSSVARIDSPSKHRKVTKNSTPILGLPDELIIEVALRMLPKERLNFLITHSSLYHLSPVLLDLTRVALAFENLFKSFPLRVLPTFNLTVRDPAQTGTSSSLDTLTPQYNWQALSKIYVSAYSARRYFAAKFPENSQEATELPLPFLEEMVTDSFDAAGTSTPTTPRSSTDALLQWYLYAVLKSYLHIDQGAPSNLVGKSVHFSNSEGGQYLLELIDRFFMRATHKLDFVTLARNLLPFLSPSSLAQVWNDLVQKLAKDYQDCHHLEQTLELAYLTDGPVACDSDDKLFIAITHAFIVLSI